MDALQQQYEKFPYPKHPLLARVHEMNSFMLNYEAAFCSSFTEQRHLKEKPRILIVGCGSFEPCVVALANPNASEIVAIDLSINSLRRLKLHLLRHGIYKRVRIIHGDFLKLSSQLGCFDYIFASGVIHHLENPQFGMQTLHSLLNDFGIIRAMIYSKYGRSSVYKIQKLVKSLSISKPSQIKRLIASLPKDHPLKFHFFLYNDKNNSGLVDGFMNARDQAYSALECEELLLNANLVSTRFIHPQNGYPEDLDNIIEPKSSLSDWEKLDVLDKLGELETNFMFYAIKKSNQEKKCSPEIGYKYNPILEKYRKKILGPKSVYSRILRKKFAINKIIEQMSAAEIKSYELAQILIRDPV